MNPLPHIEELAKGATKGPTAYLDTEFNGFGGELISLALVLDNGAEFYNVRTIPEKIEPWVAENVIPVLNGEPMGPEVFRFALHTFLSTHKPSRIVADWPSDFEHLFRELLGANHSESLALTFDAHLDPNITYESAIPHNALEDARAIKRSFRPQ